MRGESVCEGFLFASGEWVSVWLDKKSTKKRLAKAHSKNVFVSLVQQKTTARESVREQLHLKNGTGAWERWLDVDLTLTDGIFSHRRCLSPQSKPSRCGFDIIERIFQFLTIQRCRLVQQWTVPFFENAEEFSRSLLRLRKVPDHCCQIRGKRLLTKRNSMWYFPRSCSSHVHRQKRNQDDGIVFQTRRPPPSLHSAILKGLHGDWNKLKTLWMDPFPLWQFSVPQRHRKLHS